MPNEIINRVANSKLVSIDLEDYYPKGERILFDIKDWLFAEQILKENDFRESVKNYDWATLKNNYIALTCSTDAIIPSWAYLLISVSLAPYAKKIVIGNLDLLESLIFQEIIHDLSIEEFSGLKPDGEVVVKVTNIQPATAKIENIRWEVLEDEDFANDYAAGLISVSKNTADALSGFLFLTVNYSEDIMRWIASFVLKQTGSFSWPWPIKTKRHWPLSVKMEPRGKRPGKN